jgi:hypothetical protein
MTTNDAAAAYQSGMAVQADALMAARKWGKDKARECRQLEAATNRTVKEIKRQLGIERAACAARDRIIAAQAVEISNLKSDSRNKA